MRYLFFFLCLLAPVALTPGCATTPGVQATAVKTLGAIGTAAKATVDASAQLLAAGEITVAQWQKIADFYDNKFQPAFAIAVQAARSDLSSIASPDVTALAQQLADLASQLSTHP